MSSANAPSRAAALSHVNFTSNPESWPALHLEDWKDTLATLHMWTQIVGKVRLALSAHVNHWWEVPLYVSACGLTTQPIPNERGVFEVEFDFLHHQLRIETSQGTSRTLPLAPRSVADFYKEFMAALRSLGVGVKIWPVPVEVPDPIPFEKDSQHASYDAGQANRFWQILLAADTVFKEFRGRFVGKDSPVHFFWGSFDLAVTRFSGRRAPERKEADPITREAYSHEVISAGFWPGGGDVRPPRRETLCSNSCRAPTTRQPILENGTGRRWSGRRRTPEESPRRLSRVQGGFPVHFLLAFHP
jgi:hypothetical protein